MGAKIIEKIEYRAIYELNILSTSPKEFTFVCKTDERSP